MMEPLLQEIETAIQNRRLDLVRRLVPAYLSEQKQSLPARLQASECYRRISDFPSALRVLHSELEPGNWQELDETAVQLQLQLARILNLLGASSYALRIVDRVPEKFRARFDNPVGGILVSNYRYRDALPYFAAGEKIPEAELSYAQRLRLISAADCHYGLGDSSRAHFLIERVLRLSKEGLIQGIAHQAQGAYHLMSGQLKKASEHLELSRAHFSPDDTTLDRGFLNKWLGALHVLEGRPDEARVELKEAWKILYRPGFKPEAWLEILYWQGLAEQRTSKKFPSAWARLLSYPGPGNRLQAKIREHGEIPESFLFTLKKLVTRPSPEHLEPMQDLKTRTQGARVTRKLGLDLPERLLSLLIVAGPHGIPQYRTYEALWPDEIFSFSQHQKRVEQVILRLRKSKTQVAWENSHLTCREGQEVSCGWSAGPSVPGGGFLRGRVEFQRSEVERHFKLSRRSAAYLCEQWEERGLVTKSAKKGPMASYLVVSSGTSTS